MPPTSGRNSNLASMRCRTLARCSRVRKPALASPWGHSRDILAGPILQAIESAAPASADRQVLALEERPAHHSGADALASAAFVMADYRATTTPSAFLPMRSIAFCAKPEAFMSATKALAYSATAACEPFGYPMAIGTS